MDKTTGALEVLYEEGRIPRGSPEGLEYCANGRKPSLSEDVVKDGGKDGKKREKKEKRKEKKRDRDEIPGASVLKYFKVNNCFRYIHQAHTRGVHTSGSHHPLNFSLLKFF